MLEGLNANSFNDVADAIHRSAISACGGVARLKVPGSLKLTSPRRGMFNTLTSMKGQEKLTRVLYQLGGEPAPGQTVVRGAISKYLGSRWYSFTALIVSVVVFVVAIMVSCSVFNCSRRCCGAKKDDRPDTQTSSMSETDSFKESSARNRQMRSTLVQIGRHIRVGLFILSALCFVTLAVLVGFGIRSSVDLINTTDVISCNMWMELDGYFNGAHDAKPSNLPTPWMADYEDGNDSSSALSLYLSTDSGQDIDGKTLLSLITNNWLGSQAIKQGLEELNALTSPTDNPVYKNFTEGRLALQKVTEDHETRIAGNLTLVSDIIKDYTTFTALINPYLKPMGLQPIGNWQDEIYNIKFALSTVFSVKADLFRNELLQTLTDSWPVIDALIEKYAGKTSNLMNNANAAVRHSLQTILQIDQAMKNMYDVWNSKGSLLTALNVTEVALASLYFTCAIVAGGMALFLSIVLVRKSPLDSNSPPLRSHGRCVWRSTFVICCIGVAFSALSAGVTLFASTTGSDACQLADKTLLTEGDWAVLGSHILHPAASFDNSLKDSEPSATVDMRQVLDVCMKRDGDGSIGSRLGIDAAIAEVNENVNDAIEDINLTRERLLLRKSRTMRIRIIGFIMEELLRGWTHEGHFPKSAQAYTFNEYQQINWENHTKFDGGRRVMLGFTPEWPDLLSIISKGLFYGLASLPDAYNYLNDLSDAAFAANPSTTLPRFCGPIAHRRQLACSFFDSSRPVVDLADPAVTLDTINTYVGFDGTNYGLDNDLPTYDNYENSIGERTRHLIGALRFVEVAGSVTTSQLKWKEDDPRCTVDGICTFDELRELDAQIVAEQIWPAVREEYLALVGEVDAYVDELVIPSTENMVNKANDLMINTNCQYQRTVVDYAVVAPLCGIIFPATIELSLLSFLSFIVLSLLTILLWAYKPVFSESAAIVNSRRDDFTTVNVVVSED